MKNFCALLHIIFFSQQDDTKIVNFDEGVSILWPYFLRQCSRFALLSQKSQFTHQNVPIVWLPRVKCLLLLCKAKPVWIKRSIHYVTITIGGSYSKKFLPTSNVTFDTKGANFENDTVSKNGSRIKTPSSKSLILVSFCWKKNVLLINALTNLI